MKKSMNTIHISKVQAMMQRPEPLDLTVLRGSDGAIIEYPNCISLRYDFYSGTRTIKLLNSNEVRRLRDVCILRVNGMEVVL